MTDNTEKNQGQNQGQSSQQSGQQQQKNPQDVSKKDPTQENNKEQGNKQGQQDHLMPGFDADAETMPMQRIDQGGFLNVRNVYVGPAEVAGLPFSVRRSYSDRFPSRAQFLHFARRQLQTIYRVEGECAQGESLLFNTTGHVVETR